MKNMNLMKLIVMFLALSIHAILLPAAAREGLEVVRSENRTYQDLEQEALRLLRSERLSQEQVDSLAAALERKADYIKRIRRHTSDYREHMVLVKDSGAVLHQLACMSNLRTNGFQPTEQEKILLI